MSRYVAFEEKYFTDNYKNVTTINEVESLLKTSDLYGTEALIVIYKYDERKNKEIIPTLSCFKDSVNNITYFDNCELIYKTIAVTDAVEGVDRSLNSLISFASNYAYSHLDISEHKLTLFLKSQEGKDLNQVYNKLIKKSKYINIIRINSVNILNDSMAIRREELILLSKLMTDSKDETVGNICDFIKNRYGHMATYVRYDYGEKAYITPSSHSSALEPTIIANVNDLIKDKTEYRPILFDYGANKHTIFPVVGKKKKSNTKPTYLIIVSWEKSILKYLIVSIVFFIEEYIDNFIVKRKLELIQEIQKDTLEMFRRHSQHVSPLSFNYLDTIRNFASPVLKSVIKISNAFSITIRLYDHTDNSLVRICHEHEDNVELNVSEKASDRIPVKDSKYSINAKTYVNKNKIAGNDFIYIKNLEDYFDKNDEYSKGYRYISYKNYRKHSMSELCLLLSFKKTKIGVINIESPIISAFNDEVDFLLTIRDLIENYIAVLFDLNDKTWLARKAPIYQASHELENLIKLNPEATIKHKDLAKYLDVTKFSIDIQSEKIGLLNQYHNKLICNYTDFLDFDAVADLVKLERESSVNNIKFVVPVDVEDLEISSIKATLIKIMYKNIIHNYFKKGILCNGTVYFEILKNVITLTKEKRIVTITLCLKTTAKTKITNYSGDLGYTPIIIGGTRTKRLSYGLFIVGMIARHLSGFCNISGKDNYFYLDACIPLLSNAEILRNNTWIQDT